MGGNWEPDLDIFVMPLQHPSRDTKQEVGYKEGSIPARNINLESLSVIIKLIFNLIGSQETQIFGQTLVCVFLHRMYVN